MQTATQLKEFAQLSQAAYAHFDATKTESGIWEKLKIIPNEASRFCDTQAEELTARYEILHQYEDNPDSNGFSATLFRDKESKQLVLAFRGTEFTNDKLRDLLFTDLRIGIDGYASPQAIAEYRYIKQLMTAGGYGCSSLFLENLLPFVLSVSKYERPLPSLLRTALRQKRSGMYCPPAHRCADATPIRYASLHKPLAQGERSLDTASI